MSWLDIDFWLRYEIRKYYKLEGSIYRGNKMEKYPQTCLIFLLKDQNE